MGTATENAELATLGTIRTYNTKCFNVDPLKAVHSIRRTCPKLVANMCATSHIHVSSTFLSGKVKTATFSTGALFVENALTARNKFF